MNVVPDSIRLVGEADLLELARVGRGAWNGWIKNGHVGPSATALYTEQDVIHLTVLKLLGDSLPMSKAAIAWRDCETAVIQCCANRGLEKEGAPLDLVVDLQTLAAHPAEGAQDLFDTVHSPVPSPRGRVVIQLSAVVQEARASFWRRARPASDFATDRRRKPAARRSPKDATPPRSISPANSD
jgi:hypothetical protein